MTDLHTVLEAAERRFPSFTLLDISGQQGAPAFVLADPECRFGISPRPSGQWQITDAATRTTVIGSLDEIAAIIAANDRLKADVARILGESACDVAESVRWDQDCVRSGRPWVHGSISGAGYRLELRGPGLRLDLGVIGRTADDPEIKDVIGDLLGHLGLSGAGTALADLASN